MSDNTPRPVLKLKRRPSASAEVEADTLSPVVSRRKVIVVNNTPRYKKKKVATELLVVPQQAVQAESPVVNNVAPVQRKKVRPNKRAFMVPSEIAVKTLRAFWPGLFDDEQLRPLAAGTREALFRDAENNEFPLSRKQIVRCLKSLTRTTDYQSSIVAGAARYDLNGAVSGYVTTDDEAYARDRVRHLKRRESQRSLREDECQTQ